MCVYVSLNCIGCRGAFICIRHGLELDLGFTIGDKGRENKSGWEGGAFTIGDRSGKDMGDCRTWLGLQ